MGHGGPNSRNKKEPADLKSEIVYVKLQIKGSECDPENILEQHPV